MREHWEALFVEKIPVLPLPPRRGYRRTLMMRDITILSTSTIVDEDTIGANPLWSGSDVFVGNLPEEDEQWDADKTLVGASPSGPATWQNEYTTLTNPKDHLPWKNAENISDSSTKGRQTMLLPICSRRIMGFFTRQPTNFSARTLLTCSMLVLTTLPVLVTDLAHLVLYAFSYLLDECQDVLNENSRRYRFFVREVFQFSLEKSRSPKHIVKKSKLSRNAVDWMLLIFPVCVVCQCTLAYNDIRGELSEFHCLHYDHDSSTFSMNCSFVWSDDTSKCIVLHKHENFEGNGHSIDLNGVINWEGLFRIATSAGSRPSLLDDAPVIHDVHTIGGETSSQGGFIIQAEQKHFVVRNCSSSGVIKGAAAGGGGGICGQQCSGEILITHCWSTGEIGYSAGGIAGRELGIDGDNDSTVAISHCYSTGDLVGQNSGGICGRSTGYNNKGIIIIKQCYSLGKIGGLSGGGITGGLTADTNGHVSIMNCYSRGDITGSSFTGGICGRNAGQNGGIVTLTNVYASGTIADNIAGGLIGSIHSDVNQINITMSVYNGDTGDMIRTGSNAAHRIDKNSGELRDITGTVYCYTGDHSGGNESTQKECWDSETIWEAVDGDFPIFKADVQAVTATVPPSSVSPTPKEMETQTPTSTSTGTNTEWITPFQTAQLTPTITKTPSQTGSLTPLLTSSETVASSILPTSPPPSETNTATSLHLGTLTSTGIPPPLATQIISKTVAVTPSKTRSKTPNGTPSSSVAPTNKQKREQMELPVQYPPRSVVMKRDMKRKIRERID